MYYIFTIQQYILYIINNIDTIYSLYIILGIYSLV